MDIVILLIAGGFAGLLAGLLGIGGGLVVVPVLALVFSRQGVDASVVMHLAIGTSLATIITTAIASIRAHHQQQAVQWPIFRHITPGIVLGAMLGSYTAEQLDGDTLRIAFGCFILLVALRMARSGNPAPHRRLPALPGLTVAGTLIGSISAIMGVGGGTMSVPFLSWCGVSVRHAVATAAAIGLPIAITGTLGFILSGLGAAGRPEFSLGYINLPAYLGIVFASIIFAPLGARLAHRIPPLLLKRLFALFLLFVGARLLWGSL